MSLLSLACYEGHRVLRGMHHILRRCSRASCSRLRPSPSPSTLAPSSSRTFFAASANRQEATVQQSSSLVDRLREKRGPGPLPSSSTPSSSDDNKPAVFPTEHAIVPDSATVDEEARRAQDRLRKAEKSRRKKERKRARWEKEEKARILALWTRVPEEAGQEKKVVKQVKGVKNPWEALRQALEKMEKKGKEEKEKNKNAHPLRAPYSSPPFDQSAHEGLSRAVLATVSAASTHGRTRNQLESKHKQLEALMALKKPWGELSQEQKYEEVGLAKQALVQGELARRRSRGESTTFDKANHPLLAIFGYAPSGSPSSSSDSTIAAPSTSSPPSPPPSSDASSSTTSTSTPDSLSPAPNPGSREVWTDIGKRLHERARQNWPKRLQQIDKRINWLRGQLSHYLHLAHTEAEAVVARSGTDSEVADSLPRPPGPPSHRRRREGEGDPDQQSWLDLLAGTAELGKLDAVQSAKLKEVELLMDERVRAKKEAQRQQREGGKKGGVAREEGGEREGRTTRQKENSAPTPSYVASHPALDFSSSSSSPSAPLRPLSSYPHTLSPSSTPFTPHPSPHGPIPIPSLSHGLRRALYNPGVHFLRDPRTGVYNFDPETLENVPRVEEFEFGKLPQYVTSSRDETLMEIARGKGRKFVGSTSSTVGMLCQIYFWLSKGKPLNTDMLSADFREMDRTFSMGQRLPVSVVLNHTPDGRYAIDADKSFDSTANSNVLADYGHLMEKLLTTEAKEFKRFLVDAEDPAPSEADQKQAYHYALTDHLVLRSQLDASDPYLPNKTFDLKTRGTVAIRQDRLNYEESAGYEILRLRGAWESFEREYYDLIRSAFLKYQFQARIGHMDGVLVAYHSTARFFGFQYVPISEMDDALFGNSQTGEQVFKLALGVLEHVLQEAAACYPGESVNVTWAADAENGEVLRVFVAPQKAVEDLQAQTRAASVAQEEGAGEVDGGEAAKTEASFVFPSVEAVKAAPMTLLEIRGTNYLNGEAQPGAVTIPSVESSRVSDDASTPVWQVGYEITKSATDDPNLDFLYFVSSSSPSSPSGVDSSSTDASSSAAVKVPAERIALLFTETRQTQTMFSSLALPTGVSLDDVKAAAERAKEKGVELDASDLSVRFPLGEGVEYKQRPSRGVRQLRQMARERAAKRRRESKAEEEKNEKRVQVVSRIEEIEAE